MSGRNNWQVIFTKDGKDFAREQYLPNKYIKEKSDTEDGARFWANEQLLRNNPYKADGFRIENWP